VLVKSPKVKWADTGFTIAIVLIAKIAIVSIAVNFLCKFSSSPLHLLRVRSTHNKLRTAS
jgi:hypothetical protein